MKRLSPGYFVLLALVAGRFVAALLPNMWLWGMNAERFLPRPAAWLAWSALGLACVPAALDRLAPAFDGLGQRLARSFGWRIVLALVVGVVVLALDDRTWFTGDFLIRHGGLSAAHITYAQAMPLELILFETLPRAYYTVLPPGAIHRALGCIAAVGIAVASLELARAWTRRGVHLVAVASLMTFGGYLVVCTGLGKPSALLCGLTAVAGVLAFRSLDDRRALLALACVVSVTMILHRAGVLLLPCWAVAVSAVLSRRPRVEPRPIEGVVVSLPLIVGMIMAVRIVGLTTGIDLPRHLGGLFSRGAHTSSGAWLGPIDRANLVVLMLPLAVPALAAAWAARAWPRSWHSGILLALVVPWAALGAVSTPGQGVFRDLDFYAPGFMSGGLLCGWLFAHALGDTRRDDRFSVGAALVAIVSTLSLLACFHDVGSGLSRVRAYLEGPPVRSESERALGWDFLALRSLAVRDWALAATACERAAELAPSPRMLIMLGIARTYSGDYTGARNAYEQVLARTPDEPMAWAGLAGIADRLQNSALADSAWAQARLHRRSGSRAGEIQELIEEYPQFAPRGDRSR